MKRLLVTALALSASLQANATVLTFDSSDQFIGGGNYLAEIAGTNENNFAWTNFRALDPIAAGGMHVGSGYDVGTVSPTWVAFNVDGGPASVGWIGGVDFRFDGAYFAAAWNDGLVIDVVGSRDGVGVYQTSFIVDTSGPTWVNFDWIVDSLSFVSHDGVQNEWLNGHGTHFAMDNFTYHEQEVPEPASLALLGMGLLGLGFARRRGA